jgi:hypothetical protein
VHWFACGVSAPRLRASAARLAERWAPGGVSVHFHSVDGAQFWGTTEIAECPALLAATNAIFASNPS